MSSDNHHIVVQRPDGKWIGSRNHSTSGEMSVADALAWYHAYCSGSRSSHVFDTSEEALAWCEEEYSEYGAGGGFGFEAWYPEALRSLGIECEA